MRTWRSPMRREMEVKITVVGHHLEVLVSAKELIGSTWVNLADTPEFDLIVGPEESTKALLKDALIHAVEHL